MEIFVDKMKWHVFQRQWMQCLGFKGFAIPCFFLNCELLFNPFFSFYLFFWFCFCFCLFELFILCECISCYNFKQRLQAIFDFLFKLNWCCWITEKKIHVIKMLLFVNFFITALGKRDNKWQIGIRFLDWVPPHGIVTEKQ